MSHGMQAACKSWEKQECRLLFVLPKVKEVLLIPGFLLSEIDVGLCPYRNGEE